MVKSERCKKCQKCGKVIRHWNKSGLCTIHSIYKAQKEYYDANSKKILKRRKELRKLKKARKAQVTCACVACGKQATRGSLKHPYCERCFKKVFKGNHNAYMAFLEATHG